MTINWLGKTCFKISASSGAELLIDPFEKEAGFRAPKISEGNIILFTEPNSKPLPGNFTITGPGEYDIKEIYIQGVEGFKKDKSKTTIYIIEAEGIKICHLGLLGQKELDKKELEGIGEIDILMIPAGGKESLEAKEALEVMSEIEPRITIPMNCTKEELDKFLKALGIKSLEALPKLSVKKKDLPQEEAKIIVLEP